MSFPYLILLNDLLYLKSGFILHDKSMSFWHIQPLNDLLSTKNALLRAAPRCRAGRRVLLSPSEPAIRRSISGLAAPASQRRRAVIFITRLSQTDMCMVDKCICVGIKSK